MLENQNDNRGKGKRSHEISFMTHNYLIMITLGNESYYINSKFESRSHREQIKCFYYILVTFCINIHFSWVLISFAWIKVICAKNRCIIVGSQKSLNSWGDVETLDEQEEERRWPQKKKSTIGNNAVLLRMLEQPVL